MWHRLGGSIAGKDSKRMWHLSRELKGTHYMGIWGKSVSDSGNGMCKGPEVGTSLEGLRPTWPA